MKYPVELDRAVLRRVIEACRKSSLKVPDLQTQASRELFAAISNKAKAFDPLLRWALVDFTLIFAGHAIETEQVSLIDFSAWWSLCVARAQCAGEVSYDRLMLANASFSGGLLGKNDPPVGFRSESETIRSTIRHMCVSCTNPKIADAWTQVTTLYRGLDGNVYDRWLHNSAAKHWLLQRVGWVAREVEMAGMRAWRNMAEGNELEPPPQTSPRLLSGPILAAVKGGPSFSYMTVEWYETDEDELQMLEHQQDEQEET